MAHVKITYIGHASFCFQSQKGTTVYFDAWLDENPLSKLKVKQVKKADVVVASHGHNDHIGDSFALCKKTRAKFVGNYELCLAAQANGLKLGSRALPLNPGGSTKVKDVKFTMVQAFHSLSLSSRVLPAVSGDESVFHADGAVGGYVMSFDNGISIYDTSDTCLFSDMQLIGQMYGPQVAILPVGGKFTMGVREAARAASYIRPDLVIPCHYGEPVGQPADIDELKAQVKFLSPNTEVVALRPGQSLTYTASSYRMGK
jgi:L-ascorbate metabolism protein UlaG (beta-lactamase superfamily)